MKMIFALFVLSFIGISCAEQPTEVSKSEMGLSEALRRRDLQSQAWELNQRSVQRANTPSEIQNLKTKYPEMVDVLTAEAKHAVVIDSVYIYNQSTKCRFGDDRLTWEDVAYQVCYAEEAKSENCVSEVNQAPTGSDPCQ